MKNKNKVHSQSRQKTNSLGVRFSFPNNKIKANLLYKNSCFFRIHNTM